MNATKVAVMKASDVEVVTVGPELLFLIHKCRFLVRDRDAERLPAELTLAQRRPCGTRGGAT